MRRLRDGPLLGDGRARARRRDVGSEVQGMQADFSGDRSARRYGALYNALAPAATKVAPADRDW